MEDLNSNYDREGLGYKDCTTCSYGTSKHPKVSYGEGEYFSCPKNVISSLDTWTITTIAPSRSVSSHTDRRTCLVSDKDEDTMSEVSDILSSEVEAVRRMKKRRT